VREIDELKDARGHKERSSRRELYGMEIPE
jgi:hypothetical protein